MGEYQKVRLDRIRGQADLILMMTNFKSNSTGRTTDVYVIFQGFGGGMFTLTLIIPAVNFTWIGIVLFAIGIILIMAVKSRPKDG